MSISRSKENIPSEIVAHPYLIIKDITGDGRKEVLFTVKTEDGYREGVVFCFDRRGREMWRFRAGRPIRFGRQDYADFVTRGFEANDLDNDGRQEVIVISHGRGFFPTQLAVLSSDGKLLGEFWNSGQLTDIAFVDLEPTEQKKLSFPARTTNTKRGAWSFSTRPGSPAAPRRAPRSSSPRPFPQERKDSMSSSQDRPGSSEFPSEAPISSEVLTNDLILVPMALAASFTSWASTSPRGSPGQATALSKSMRSPFAREGSRASLMTPTSIISSSASSTGTAGSGPARRHRTGKTLNQHPRKSLLRGRLE